MQATGLELHRLALHAYSYLHLTMIAGVVLFALGLKRRTIGSVVLLGLIPIALAVSALAALALVSAVCALVVAYEAIRYRDHRVRVRHPEAVA